MNDKKLNLLDERGFLTKPGFSNKSIFHYDRSYIKASKWRIKEWDYYACINDDFAVSFTIADLGYMGMLTASYLDFKTAKETKRTFMIPLTFGKLDLPNTPDVGDIEYKAKKCSFKFFVYKDSKELKVSVKNFIDNQDFKANLKLLDNKDDRMVIATPWVTKKPRFYYNQKINCMPTSGTVIIGDKTYKYDSKKHFSVLDWGRGVWTYKNTWYWGSLSGLVNDKRFGFNIGYGFGDTSNGTENVLFYDGIAHKLDQIKFEFDNQDYMKAWKFTSNDSRLELTMTPVLDRIDNTNLLVIKNFGHQVFGKFNGYVKLDDGTKLEIKDLIGFAEEITNHY